MIKVKYKLKKIYPKVYQVDVNNMYDLCMLFCRVQEFYESPLDEIRGKHFTILEFMKLYSEKFGDGVFTYTVDWGGFNIPSMVLQKCYYSKQLKDENDYDRIMKKIHMHICNEVSNGKYYLIGTPNNDTDTKNHEISHAFYYLYPDYKNKVDKLTDKLPKSIYNKIIKSLKRMGYNEYVYKDEIQAYLSNDYSSVLPLFELNPLHKNKFNFITNELKKINKDYKEGK